MPEPSQVMPTSKDDRSQSAGLQNTIFGSSTSTAGLQNTIFGSTTSTIRSSGIIDDNGNNNSWFIMYTFSNYRVS